MAFPTAVNDQITDSITQSNTKVLGDAPAIAMGNLYQATSQALSNAAHNATATQQQAAIIAQAALTQGVSILYSIDTADSAVATSEMFKASAATEEARQTSGQTLEDGGKAEAGESTSAVQESTTLQTEQLTSDHEALQNTINQQIEDAVKFALETNLGSADRFNHAVREVMDAFVSSLTAIADSQHKSAMNTVKTAAIVKTLQAMIEHPEQYEHYAKVLETVRGL